MKDPEENRIACSDNYKKNIEERRAKSRAYYYANRAAILAKMRAKREACGVVIS
jgi:hypothetical protein